MVSAGTTIISQGDTNATKFYILEKGTCDVLITNEATGNVPKKVHTYPSGRCASTHPKKRMTSPQQTRECMLTCSMQSCSLQTCI